MIRNSKALLSSILLLLMPSTGFAASMKAYVSRSGEVALKDNSGKLIATLRPGVFEAGWRNESFAVDPGAPVTDQGSGIIHSPGGASLSSRSTIATDGDSILFDYEFETDKPVDVNEIYVSATLPCQRWIDGAWKSDEKTGTLPKASKEMQLFVGDAKSLSLQKDANRLAFSGEASQPFLIQDNRYFSGSDFEIRMTSGGGSVRTWNPGQPVSIRFALKTGSPVQLIREKPMILEANSEWIPLDLKLDVTPGGALDFSFLNDAPAGKNGWIIATPEGHFVEEKRPNKPLRFYGVNLCFSANYPDHALADRLAERLARIGYNAVRIHHYESELTDPSASDSLTFRKDSLDRLDYLFAALKKHGIYVTTDLFVSRPVRPDEAPGEGGDDYKMATLVSEKAMANWKAFSKALLTHVNPYAGLAYKDDPTLAWISVVNEPNAPGFIGRLSGDLLALFQARWTAWLKARYASDSDLAKAWGDPGATLDAPLPKSISDTAEGGDLGVFLATLHEKAYDEMSGYLKKEIGVKALLTYLNGWSETPALMAVRENFDYVDNHFYWDHPNFIEKDWQLPSRGWSGGGSALEKGGAGPDGVSMTRLYGKPFAVSEYNYAAPNQFRAESGLIMGTAAALQGWDVLWRFAYSHSSAGEDSPAPLDYFNMASDPIQQASERAALLLFLRRDASEAPHRIASVAHRADLMGQGKPHAISSFSDLSLITRVGAEIDPAKGAAKNEIRLESSSSSEALNRLRAQPGFPAANRTNLDAGLIQSETGESTIDSRSERMTVKTPRTVGGIAHDGETIQAGPLLAKIGGCRAALWISSLDGQPVEKSRRALIVHATDSQSAGMRYASQEMMILERWGGSPHLVQAGTAEVTLTHENPSRLKAWRLDTTGKRIAPLKVEAKEGKAILHLSTRDAEGKATLYYEIVEE